jgi:NADH:ubiquinone oxidoreductase subunit 5 (subunit L)/multisubunit Na+/H+ antiporter MnhA subunit
VAFLGNPRTAEGETVHEADGYMLAPMGLLAVLCVFAGLLPQVMVSLLRPALFTWAPDLAARPEGIAAMPPLRWLTIAGAGVLSFAGVLAIIFRRRLRSSPIAGGDTWGCGYLHPTASMQYTAASFGDTAVNLFGGVVRPLYVKPALPGYFPRPELFTSKVPEALLEHMIFPFFRVTGEVFSFLRRLQLGKIHIYMLYIFVTLVLLLFWAY